MEKIARLLKSKNVAAFLVVLGISLTIFFGWRAFHAFRQMPPFPPRPPKPIEDEDAIRPWMNLKYISKVYGVPTDYIVEYLNLPPKTNPGHQSLEELNAELALGTTETGELFIIQRLNQAILEFHAHPEFREKRLIQADMSIHFIATVAGISQETLFEQLGISSTGNEYKSLDVLSQEQNYPGGLDAFVQTVQALVDAEKGD